MVVVLSVLIDAAEKLIEPPRNLAREFEVRHLVFTDWHADRAEREDVGRLSNRIEGEAE